MKQLAPFFRWDVHDEAPPWFQYSVYFLENIADGKLDDTFHVRPGEDDLYMFMRTEDIESLNAEAGLQRMQIISPDGPANHMRREVNALTEKQFQQFIKYQMSVCERADLLGASAHTVDILKKN